jgi:uncharacterized phage protein (TIGR01671 family)
MREILYRGKTEQGTWLYGFYTKGFRYPDEEKLHDMIYMFSVDGKTNNWGFTDAKVIPETVGQFTGLTDKNGKKIFEGDIIKILPFHSAGLHYEAVAIVCFDRGAFSCKILDHNPASLYMYEKWRVVVIGNIHDNLELLGE